MEIDNSSSCARTSLLHSTQSVCRVLRHLPTLHPTQAEPCPLREMLGVRSFPECQQLHLKHILADFTNIMLDLTSPFHHSLNLKRKKGSRGKKICVMLYTRTSVHGTDINIYIFRQWQAWKLQYEKPWHHFPGHQSSINRSNWTV